MMEFRKTVQLVSLNVKFVLINRIIAFLVCFKGMDQHQPQIVVVFKDFIKILLMENATNVIFNVNLVNIFLIIVSNV